MYYGSQLVSMKNKTDSIKHSSAWHNVAAHASKMKDIHMSDLFDRDPSRFDNFSIKLKPFLLDYSKNLITHETMSLLATLAKASKIEQWRN